MITTIATTLVTPFMVADAQEKPVTPETPVAITYNWQSQTATEGVSDGSFDADQTLRGSQSLCGSQMVIDDWYLA